MPINRNLQIIGARAHVSFSNHDIENVPAKVDSGADSSSVWASQIEEHDGVLSFVLFDSSTPWYTGNIVQVDDYQIRSIKNSFGVSEYRYKVLLSVVIDGKKVKARFTLSDRSNSRYPILIGRKTLKNRFLIDVSHEVTTSDPAKVLVLMNCGSHKIFEFYKTANNTYGDKIQYDIRFYDDLIVTVDGKHIQAYFSVDGKRLCDYDLIYLKIQPRKAELAPMLALVAKKHNITFIDSIAQCLVQPEAKSYQALAMSISDLATPATLYMDKSKWAHEYERVIDVVGSPFIFKDNYGLKGRHNYLIKNKSAFEKIVAEMTEQNVQMIAQQYIPNDGYYRIIVMGRKVRVIMHRSIDSNRSHLYKRSFDGLPVKLRSSELPGHVIKASIKAAECMNLEIAGVDMVRDNQTGEWSCLEINISPQLASGAFVPEKMKLLSDYFIEEINK